MKLDSPTFALEVSKEVAHGRIVVAGGSGRQMCSLQEETWSRLVFASKSRLTTQLSTNSSQVPTEELI